MKVFLVSRHLAKSTLKNKVAVYAMERDIPKSKAATKAQEQVQVCVEVQGKVDNEEQLLKEFMVNHEERLGITLAQLLSRNEYANLTPLRKLMRILLMFAGKANEVLTVNQKLSQERAALNTQLEDLIQRNDDVVEENEKLLATLQELNGRLTNQSKARELYEKEAKALREDLTIAYRKRAGKRFADVAVNTQDNVKGYTGEVHLHADDPAWKNWTMIVHACPKCFASPAPFPNRTVGCSRGCLAKDDAESMSPESWNDWVSAYENKVNEISSTSASKKEDEQLGFATSGKKAPDSVIIMDGKEIHPESDIHRCCCDVHTTEAPVEDDEECQTVSAMLRYRVALLEEKVEALLSSGVTTLNALSTHLSFHASGRKL